MDPMLTEVAGVSFRPGYPDSLLRLHDLESAHGQGAELTTAILVPEPENRYDANAIRVQVPALGEGDDGHIGYVPASLCEQVHEMLAGGRVRASVSTRVHPHHTDRPGCDLQIEVVDPEAAG